MNTVACMLQRKKGSLLSVGPQTTVLEALAMMAKHNVGSVIIMDKDAFLGIMTERDYSRKVILKDKNSISTKVEEIMSKDMPAVHPSDTTEHCMQLMTENNIRYMPVIENNKITGIISMSDVVKATIGAQKDTISQLHNYINS